MIIVKEKISRAELAHIAESLFGDMVKAVCDVETGMIAIDAELHADLESLLLECGSLQENLWGFNLYPTEDADSFIEYDSLINIRPRQNNRSRCVEDATIRQKIEAIVRRWFNE